MEKPTPFLIYNAAAGSGKTFTLVKEYVKQILMAKNEGYYKHLLAITFTNKAVAEMKQRIVSALVAFSTDKNIAEPTPMMFQISEETGMIASEIQDKARKILKHLLHNYAAFSVETIDRFNHRIIRTFARDLKLATNFEVTLDTPQLLAEAVDSLLSKAGENEAVTKVLLDFALEKTDDDKSWDISKDIVKAAGLLFNENEAAHVNSLKQKTLSDFQNFKTQLLQKAKGLSAEIKGTAKEVLQLIDESGLQHDDFMRKILPNHFVKLQAGEYNVYGNKLQQNLEEAGGLYKKDTLENIASTIDAISPILLEKYLIIKANVNLLNLTTAILKNLTPLSVINLVQQEIENIKSEKNIFPISEFNALINEEIKNQPAPFIYERLGEKYRHFFIDEFQDTSKLQWENLIPLIDNALSQNIDDLQGNLLLVGDAKQSIYRWRGGLPEQFMELCNKEVPFSVPDVKLQNLETNYRSFKEIIDFNNQFFSFVSPYFANPVHAKMYLDGNKQNFNTKENGYVKFEFIEKRNRTENIETYAKLVYETVTDLKEKDFSENDICILTRRKSDGIALGAHLMERGINVVSSETLLLQTSPLVQILELSLIVSLHPFNEEAKINLLELLHNHLLISEEKHSFFTKFLKSTSNGFSEAFSTYGIDFDFKEMKSVSLYEAFEYCIQKFKLAKNADAYLFGFMDLVFEFEQQPMADKISFLEYWETKRESASVAAGEGTNAVQLMTIHKAKGLEFPVVIFPFADINLYDAKKDTLWYPLPDEEFLFNEAQINFKKEIADYSSVGLKLYNQHRSMLELDNINLLYVTLTRAVEKLFVFAEMPTTPKDNIPVNYNQLFMGFLKQKGMWSELQIVYEFGTNHKKIKNSSVENKQTTPVFISSNLGEHNLKLAATKDLLEETEVLAAITAGNLLHQTMAEIYLETDIDRVFIDMGKRGVIVQKELEILKKTIESIVSHSHLKPLFDGNSTVYNERDIITAGGSLLRPDRLNIYPDNTVIITDYKTGNPYQGHEEQLISYANALEEMGFIVSEKILIYSNVDDILINKV